MTYFEGSIAGTTAPPAGPEAPSEWLFEIVRALELSWASDGQEAALASVVEQLVASMARPMTALRVGQALLVRPELPDARTRASIGGIRDLVVRKSPVTAQSPDGVRWCQVAGLAAAGIATLKGSEPWGVVSSVLRERDHAWVRKQLNPAIVRARAIASATESWTDIRFPDDIKDHAIEPGLDRALAAYVYPKFTLAANFQTKLYDLDEIRYNSVRPSAQRLSDMNLTLLDVVNGMGRWLSRVERQIRASAETNALWWGSSLYSLRRGVSYREIPPNELLILMADDLLDAVEGQVSEAVVAYFVETARRLIHDLDGERPWADQAARMALSPQGANPLAPGLRGLISEEATGLPLLYLCNGGAPARLVDATMVVERTIGGRAWARQVFRERQLNRWFAGAE